VDELVLLGIESFWNFSHYDIHAKYPAANVENVHLSDSLMTLSYKIKNRENR
jgi:redox-sensing transcriptional repressor